MKFISVFMAVAVSAVAMAQSVPPLINYQGRLANPDGTPLPTADYELRVTIHDADAVTGGTLVWGPQVFDGANAVGHGPRVPVMQGYFNVLLGPVDAVGRSVLSAFSGSNRFVQVTVGNRPPIKPRQQIVAAPFAVQAANGSPPGTIVAFGGTSVPAGWALCDGTALDAATNSAFLGLLAALGKTFGVGNGNVTSFNLPDLRGRTAVGAGKGEGTDAGGRPLSNRLIGERLGEEAHKLTEGEMPSHTHPDAGHVHAMLRSGLTGSSGSLAISTPTAPSDFTINAADILRIQPGFANIQPKGNDLPHNVMQPSLVINYIIKL